MSNLTRTIPPFRADVVGSYLRPQELKQARAAFERGTLDADGLREVEDATIRDLIAKQTAHGVRGITDGEFRRSYWHLDFMWGLGGLERATSTEGYQFHDLETRADTVVVRDHVTGEHHPFVEHFKFVKALEGAGQVARQTIPAPIQTYSEVTLGRSPEGTEGLRCVYETDEKFADDLITAYRTVIADLYAAGCRSLQLDDCSWGIWCDSNFAAAAGLGAADVERACRQGVEINNAVLEGQPDDLVITTHVCRGNYQSTYAFAGGYDPVAPYLFADEKVSAFYLEFDTPRAGGFEPLRYVSPDAYVVLGLVSSKAPELESEELLAQRVHEAAQYVPLDRLCLSPQCGFASTEEGNSLTEKDQWAKIDLVNRVARDIWGA